MKLLKKTHPFADEAIAILPQIMAIISRDDQYHCKDLELTVPQLRFLHALFRKGQASMKDLSRALHVAPPSATVTADQLVLRKLIQRREDTRDRRSVQVCLTRKGKTLIRKFIEAKKMRWNTILSLLGSPDQENLMMTLRRLLALLQKAELTEGNLHS